jgi:hypothetical protein
MSIALQRALPRRVETHPGNLREVASLALPVVLTNLSATLMMTVDAAFVGHLGAAELGAVGYGGIWYWTVLSLFSGTATGVSKLKPARQTRITPVSGNVICIPFVDPPGALYTDINAASCDVSSAVGKNRTSHV